ncbi:MAG: hypothetical protein H3C47_07040 [Candidatus Cloacimonetes bacterium]|nr:hypothetical protein [Candidatus Cloacimonadota bacterium]
MLKQGKKLCTGIGILAVGLIASGCGGSGGGMVSGSPSVSLSGSAIKGPFRGGSVKAYGLKVDGSKAFEVLGSVTDDKFAITVPQDNAGLPYSVFIEVEGVYQSEVSGAVTTENSNLLSVAFVDSTTNKVENLLISPLSHIVANMVAAEPGIVNDPDLIQAAHQSVARNFGLTNVGILQGTMPAILTMSAQAADINTYTQQQQSLGAVLAGFEKLRGNLKYNDFFSTRLRDQTTGGSIPLQFKVDLATQIESHIQGLDYRNSVASLTASTLSSAGNWGVDQVVANPAQIKLYVNGKSYSALNPTTVQVNQAISVAAAILATRDQSLNYSFSVVHQQLGLPVKNFVASFPDSGEQTGPGSFTGSFIATQSGDYILHAEIHPIGQNLISTSYPINVLPAPTANAGGTANFSLENYVFEHTGIQRFGHFNGILSFDDNGYFTYFYVEDASAKNRYLLVGTAAFSGNLVTLKVNKQYSVPDNVSPPVEVMPANTELDNTYTVADLGSNSFSLSGGTGRLNSDKIEQTTGHCAKNEQPERKHWFANYVFAGKCYRFGKIVREGVFEE